MKEAMLTPQSRFQIKTWRDDEQDGNSSSWPSPVLDAVWHLEEAAKGGNPFAMFNLGVAAWYGYGQYYRQPTPVGDIKDDIDVINSYYEDDEWWLQQGSIHSNIQLALEWFEKSGLPEGLAAVSMYYESTNDPHMADMYMKRAIALGFGEPWRKESTGYGDFNGPQLNLRWPPVYPTGEIPPEW